MDEAPVLEGNTVFEYHDAFNADKARVAELKDAYAAGRIGDGQVKKELAEALNAFLDPIRRKRAELTDGDALDVLKSGTARANEVAEQTLWLAKQAAKFDFFTRRLLMG